MTYHFECPEDSEHSQLLRHYSYGRGLVSNKQNHSMRYCRLTCSERHTHHHGYEQVVNKTVDAPPKIPHTHTHQELDEVGVVLVERVTS